MQSVERAKELCIWKYGSCIEGVDALICFHSANVFDRLICEVMRCFKNMDSFEMRCSFAYKSMELKDKLCYGEVKDFRQGWNYIPQFVLPCRLMKW